MKDKILSQFDKAHLLFASYSEKCKGIITELLNDNYISIHHITSRVKNRDSLERKIDIKNNKYSDMSEITDICGIRIITYLDSDVNSVAELIEKEFTIDFVNSIDKRKLKSDQFGYKSMHYVASLNDQRLGISENKKFDGLKLEIQIRSILQHAWAEIEHDLGYKNLISIPENFKRNFNRIAALLETADVEFDRLKKDLSEYEIKVKDAIKDNPYEVLIDQASIASFIENNAVINKSRFIIKKNRKCIFLPANDYLFILEKLKFFNIETIGKLNEIFIQNQQKYLSFVNLFTNMAGKIEYLNKSIPLLYFFHFLAAQSQSIEHVLNYFDFGSQKLGASQKNAQHLIYIYQNS